MTKWEYLRVIVDWDSIGVEQVRCNGNIVFDYHLENKDKKEKKEFILYEYLNQLGSEGWELAGVFTFGNRYQAIHYFKRPIQT